LNSRQRRGRSNGIFPFVVEEHAEGHGIFGFASMRAVVWAADEEFIMASDGDEPRPIFTRRLRSDASVLNLPPETLPHGRVCICG
jgi:hypothetical protein